MLLTDADFAVADAVVIVVALSVSIYQHMIWFRFRAVAIADSSRAFSAVVRAVRMCMRACTCGLRMALYIHAYTSISYIGYIHCVWMRLRVRVCIRTVYISVSVLCTPCTCIDDQSTHTSWLKKKGNEGMNDSAYSLTEHLLLLLLLLSLLLLLCIESVFVQFEQRKQARHGKARQIRRT